LHSRSLARGWGRCVRGHRSHPRMQTGSASSIPICVSSHVCDLSYDRLWPDETQSRTSPTSGLRTSGLSAGNLPRTRGPSAIPCGAGSIVHRTYLPHPRERPPRPATNALANEASQPAPAHTQSPTRRLRPTGARLQVSPSGACHATRRLQVCSLRHPRVDVGDVRLPPATLLQQPLRVLLVGVV